MTPTADEIEAARTSAGGWTKDQLAEWGVPWPPPKGWKATITGEVGQEPIAVGPVIGDPEDGLDGEDWRRAWSPFGVPQDEEQDRRIREEGRDEPADA